jgi:L,D-peptidoglycan transpeptidase YkuD (ErfK/YbiS/YcfS/YnhG family)
MKFTDCYIYPWALPAVVIGLLLLAAGCAKPPKDDLESARAALEEAAISGALDYAEPSYRAAEALLRSGWIELARQNGRFFAFRNYHDADSLLSLARDWAQLAKQRAGDSLAILQGGVGEVIPQVEQQLKQWESALEGSLVYYEARDDWQNAHLQIDIARRLTEQEEYAEAFTAVKKARSYLEHIADLVGTHAADESRQLQLWRKWVTETVDASRRSRKYALIVDKSAHKTYLVKAGKLMKSYNAELGYNSARQKLFSGDAATPEGRYEIIKERQRGSQYYKALLLNYPNEEDKRRFAENKRRGVISRRAGIGGLIEIHGTGGRNRDWTEGCIALTNRDIDDLMRHVDVGTPVTIVRKSDQWP